MTPTPKAMDPPGEVCNCLALRQASRRVTQFYDQALAPVGIGVNQYSILARLRRAGPTSIQDLAGLRVMDRSTLGHLLRPLEARGFITLEVDPDDRRSRSIALTDQGRDLVRKASGHWRKAQREFENAFGARRAAEVRTVLKGIATMRYPAGDLSLASSGPRRPAGTTWSA